MAYLRGDRLRAPTLPIRRGISDVEIALGILRFNNFAYILIVVAH